MVSFKLNGADQEVEADPDMPLLWVAWQSSAGRRRAPSHPRPTTVRGAQSRRHQGWLRNEFAPFITQEGNVRIVSMLGFGTLLAAAPVSAYGKGDKVFGNFQGLSYCGY